MLTMIMPQKAALKLAISKVGSSQETKNSMAMLMMTVKSPSVKIIKGKDNSFINGLKREGLTSVLTRESSALFGDAIHYDDHIAFTVDSYLLLRYVEIESTVNRALLVLKVRGSDHAKDIRQFEVTPTGIVVKTKFEGHEGIMSGSPHRMESAFMKAFVDNKGRR